MSGKRVSTAAAARYVELHGLHPSRAAGLVQLRVVRQTGTLVGLYRAAEAGIEDDPATPWATVCEDHDGVVCHETRADAESWVSQPAIWCSVCQEQLGA